MQKIVAYLTFQPHLRPLPQGSVYAPQSFGEGRKTLKTVRAGRKVPPIGQCVQAPRLDSPPRSFGEGLGVGLKRRQKLAKFTLSY